MLPLAIVKNDAILRFASRRVTNQGNNCDLGTIPPPLPRNHWDTLKSFEDLNIYSLKITFLFKDMSYCIKVGVTLMFSTILSAVISMYRDLTTALNTQPKTISNERWCILKPADVMILRAQTNRPIPLLCEAPQSQGNNTSTRNPDTVTFFEFIYRQLMCLRKRYALMHRLGWKFNWTQHRNDKKISLPCRSSPIQEGFLIFTFRI